MVGITCLMRRSSPALPPFHHKPEAVRLPTRKPLGLLPTAGHQSEILRLLLSFSWYVYLIPFPGKPIVQLPNWVKVD